MICTEQERAALMGLIERYGSSRESYRASAIDEQERLYGEIRAMLAPDDAVVIPRELARSVYSALAMAKGDIAKSNAAAILEILQPEATR